MYAECSAASVARTLLCTEAAARPMSALALLTAN